MKKISIIVIIINLLLFWWRYFDIELSEVFLISDFELLYKYLPVGLFVLTMLLLIKLIIKYFKIYNKEWTDRLKFYTAIISSIGAFYFVYENLLLGTYFETIEENAYLFVFWFAFSLYITLWILYKLYNSVVSFIERGDFFKVGPALFVFLLLLYLYWLLVDYVFESIV